MLFTLCTKTKVLNVLALLILSQYVMSSVVSGKDITCKAGEMPAPYSFTSGLASQCSGVSKITTEAECIAAAKYNSKNNIDKNEGYVGRGSWSNFPPGCFYYSHYKKYWFNRDTKSPKKCTSDKHKCICKAKTCIKCPINTYSKGGINPICTPFVHPNYLMRTIFPYNMSIWIR
jgi:hypothetical protein